MVASALVSLVRVSGEPNSGRSGRIMSWASAVCEHRSGKVLVVDTLGHGEHAVARSVRPDVLERLIYLGSSGATDVYSAVRALVGTGALSCVVLDDLAGIEFEGVNEEMARSRQALRMVTGLASLCAVKGVSLGYVDRASHGRSGSAPVGFSDLLAAGAF